LNFQTLRRALRVGRHALGVLLALTGALPSVSASQTAAASGTLVGRVLKEGTPIGGAVVTLHQVTPRSSGVVSRQETAAEGRFRFALPPRDTSRFTVFFTTVDYQSVRYFGMPVHPGEVTPDYTVEVFDTTSSLPGAISLARRDLILLPEAEGGWTVNEVVRIVNRGRKTLVSSRGMPTWQFPIPDGAVEFQAGEGEGDASGVQLMGSRVLVTGSLIPGARELLLRYRLPASLKRADLPLPTAADTLNVFVRQPSPEVTVAGLASTRTVEFENERFVQYGGTALRTGTVVRIAWTRGGLPVHPALAGVAAALLVLAAGSWAAYRNRNDASRAPGPRPHSSPREVADGGRP